RTHRQLRPVGTHSLIPELGRYRVAQVLPVPGGCPQLTADSFGTRCLRFKWYVTAPACKARFRPVVSPCPEGVEPSGLHRKVSIRYIGLPPFPDLSWRYRKSPARENVLWRANQQSLRALASA